MPDIHIHCFLNYDSEIQDPDMFMARLCDNFPKTEVGYAGYTAKKWLLFELGNLMFNAEGKTKVKELPFNEKEIKSILKDTIRLCHKKLPIENIHVFVFPTFKDFVAKEMGGATGWTPWNRTMHLYLNPIRGWRKSLEETIVHEYNHAVLFELWKPKALLDSLIVEGLAELFVEEVLGKRSIVSKSLSKEKSLALFRKLAPLLDSADAEVRQNVLYGKKGYAKWAGYSVGYWCVKLFRAAHKDMEWSELVSRRVRKQIAEAAAQLYF